MMLRSVRFARRCCTAVLQNDRAVWYVSRKEISRGSSGEGGGETDGDSGAFVSSLQDDAGFGFGFGFGCGPRVAMQGHFSEESKEGERESESESESEEEEVSDCKTMSGGISELDGDSEFDSDLEEVDGGEERKERAENQLLLLAGDSSSESEPEEEVAAAAGPSYLHKLTISEVAKILKKTRAIDVKILNVQARCQWTDYMVFATGKSTRHIRGMADVIVNRIKKKSTEDHHLDFPSVEGRNCDDWMAVDCGHIVVHAFSEEARARYNLEQKWGGEEVFLDEAAAQAEREQAMIQERLAAAASNAAGNAKKKKKEKKKKRRMKTNIAPLVLC